MVLHERELVYRCGDCGKEYDTQPDYVKHLKVHKETLLFAEAKMAASAAAAAAAHGDKVAGCGGGGVVGGGAKAKFRCEHAGCDKMFRDAKLCSAPTFL